MGTESCFLDPHGDLLACNGMNVKLSMGNINKQTFNQIWNSEQAFQIRNKVKTCQKQCWMVGSAAPVMKKHFYIPAKWIITNKLRMIVEGK